MEEVKQVLEYNTIFPFEEEKIYKDRGIFEFKAQKVVLPLDFDTFDTLYIAPFEEISPDKKDIYMIIDIGRNRYRHEKKINMGLRYGGCKGRDHEKWKRLYVLTQTYYKTDKFENSEGEDFRKLILDFCKNENLSVYEYLSTDTFRTVEQK